MTSEAAMNGAGDRGVPYGGSAAHVLGLLRAAGQEGASRSELAARTGLTPQAVSKITARLRAHGLVTEAGRRASTGGKPSTVLRLAPGARHAVGVQLDRDHLMAVLVDLSGSVVAGRTAPLDLGAGAEAVLAAVESAVRGLVGAGLPGLAAASDGSAGAAEAEGGELWRQAAGEMWSSPRQQSGRTGAAEPEARGSRAQQAVSEEGELWSEDAKDRRGDGAGRPETGGAGELDGTGDSEAGAGADAGAEPGADAGAEPGTGAAAGSGTGPEAEHTADGSAAGEADEVPAGAAGAAGWGSVLGVGVAAPGPLDHARGVLRAVTGHPQWAGYPLRDELARRLRMPVVVDKDTNAAALGLSLRGAESLAYLHLGTGLGAGLVLEGRVHRGRRTGAGEFGHQVLQLDGPPCRCGRRGCVEALCLEAVRRGDTAEAARLLGVAAANLVSLLDVDRVLLGGSTVLARPQAYVDGVAAQLRGVRRLQHGPRLRPGGEAREAAGEDAAGGESPAGAGARTVDEGRGDAPAPAARPHVQDVPVDVVPEGARTVADGAAQLVLAPLFGRPHGTVPARPGGPGRP